jgi:hypothetical protein
MSIACEELDPVEFGHPVVGEDRRDQVAAQLHLPQRLERRGPRLGPYDPVLISVPAAQVTGHRPGYRRIVVYGKDRGPRSLGLLALGRFGQRAHAWLSIASICDLFHIEVGDEIPV